MSDKFGEAQEPTWLASAIQKHVAVELQTINDRMINIEITTNVVYNQAQGNGDDAIYKIVPFPDGADPTSAPDNLPALTSPAALRSLRGLTNLRKYYRRYKGLPRNARVPDDNQCLAEVARCIGGSWVAEGV